MVNEELLQKVAFFASFLTQTKVRTNRTAQWPMSRGKKTTDRIVSILRVTGNKQKVSDF